MAFWGYILECADGSCYVGHSDALDERLQQHQSGAVGGYTSTRRPVRLAYSQDFPTRDEAYATPRNVRSMDGLAGRRKPSSGETGKNSGGSRVVATLRRAQGERVQIRRRTYGSPHYGAGVLPAASIGDLLRRPWRSSRRVNIATRPSGVRGQSSSGRSQYSSTPLPSGSRR
jgi:putative endonuclease